MKNKPSLTNYEDWELIQELECRSYNFSKEVHQNEMIGILEESGFTINETSLQDEANYDYVDANLFLDIKEKFAELNWEGRQKLRDFIINFK